MVNGYYQGKYVGKDMCGFKHGHSYQFTLDNNGRTYELSAYMDITNEKEVDVDLYMQYASEISIKGNWKLKGN